jgi:hypothetical protein
LCMVDKVMKCLRCERNSSCTCKNHSS